MTYKELLDLAMTCAKQAHITTSKDVAHRTLAHGRWFISNKRPISTAASCLT
jgi:hypothetical protein